MVHAPVALFVYNRLHYAVQTLTSLQNSVDAEKTPLIIFADAARDAADAGVNDVRALINEVSGFASVEIHHAPANMGLRRSLLSGIDAVLVRYDRVIVLEDDIVVGPWFLRYMNEALTLYQDDDRVAAVSGNAVFEDVTLPETFFLRHMPTLGWGTWGRAWNTFERDCQTLKRALEHRGMLKAFNWYGPGMDWTRMLDEQLSDRLDSWAISWQANNFLRGALSLWPRRSLTKHIGFGRDSGTHCGHGFDEYAHINPTADPVVISHVPVAEDPTIRQLFTGFWTERLRTRGQRYAAWMRASLTARRQNV